MVFNIVRIKLISNSVIFSHIWNPIRTIHNSYSNKQRLLRCVFGDKIFSRDFHNTLVLKAKTFQERENEYAHEVMENIPLYNNSIIKSSALLKSMDLDGISSNTIRKFSQSNSRVDSEEHHLVFVYGTLKRGEPNHDLLSTKLSDGGAKFVGEAKTVHRWPLVIASRFNIPYLLHSKDKGEHVSGELYSVNSQVFKHLDELECHPTYYTRVPEEVITPEGSSLKPWIYFLFQFRPELLQLPCLADYRSKGNHGKEYVPRYNRSKEEYHSDVKIEDTSDIDDIYR